MCGITGFIGKNNNVFSLKHLLNMTNQIKHRGPDGEGYMFIDNANKIISLFGEATPIFSDKLDYIPKQSIETYFDQIPTLALGHRRLSIVDLSPLGHQPMSAFANRYWISYNGEVYNHQEIRIELESMGHKFISHSDTEVILHAYHEWGVQCLDKFNGMWAFVLYDRQNKQVFIARDRFGVKPLYYYQGADGFYFASEIKQFTQAPNWTAKLNHQAAFDFLAYGITEHNQDTMFKDVYQLRGGHYVLSSTEDFNLNIIKWYDLPNTQYNGDYATACSDFETLFKDAVKLRMRSDVAVGSCLSGGMDSSAIVCEMADILAHDGKIDNLQTFSACSHHKEFDESEYIDAVNQHTNAAEHKCYPELAEVWNTLNQVAWHQDEPFGSTSIFAQYAVFGIAAKSNIKVMLDGQGADEHLLGYQGLYFQVYLNQLIAAGNIICWAKELYKFGQIHKINTKQTILKSIMSLLPTKAKHIIGSIMGKQRYSHNWLSNKLIYQNIDVLVNTGFHPSKVKQTSYSQLMSNNLPMLLRFEDRDSMAHSIESRVPFVDYRLVELVYSMPTKYKISDGINKKVLRDGLYKLLPDKINSRMSKLGFATPEEIWFMHHSEQFREVFIRSIEYSQDVIDKSNALDIFDQIASGRKKFDSWIWRIISFGIWINIFNVKVKDCLC